MCLPSAPRFPIIPIFERKTHCPIKGGHKQVCPYYKIGRKCNVGSGSVKPDPNNFPNA